MSNKKEFELESKIKMLKMFVETYSPTHESREHNPLTIRDEDGAVYTREEAVVELNRIEAELDDIQFAEKKVAYDQAQERQHARIKAKEAAAEEAARKAKAEADPIRVDPINPATSAHMIQVDGQSQAVDSFSEVVQSLFNLMLRNRNDLNDLQYQAAIKQAAERTLQTEIAHQVKVELEEKKKANEIESEYASYPSASRIR